MVVPRAFECPKTALHDRLYTVKYSRIQTKRNSYRGFCKNRKVSSPASCHAVSSDGQYYNYPGQWGGGICGTFPPGLRAVGMEEGEGVGGRVNWGLEGVVRARGGG
jgi:hypothetical protein